MKILIIASLIMLTLDVRGQSLDILDKNFQSLIQISNSNSCPKNAITLIAYKDSMNLITYDSVGNEQKYRLKDSTLLIVIQKLNSDYRSEIGKLKYKINALEKGNVNKRREKFNHKNNRT